MCVRVFAFLFCFVFLRTKHSLYEDLMHFTLCCIILSCRCCCVLLPPWAHIATVYIVVCLCMCEWCFVYVCECVLVFETTSQALLLPPGASFTLPDALPVTVSFTKLYAVLQCPPLWESCCLQKVGKSVEASSFKEGIRCMGGRVCVWVCVWSPAPLQRPFCSLV